MKKLLLILCLLLPQWLSAQALPGITVNSLATTANTVTVTTAANHGLSANQGFCLSAPAGICAVVATVPTGTTLTFTYTSPEVCSSSCGTIQAAKQIVILGTNQPTANSWSATVLFWLTTTQPVPGHGSQWTAGGSSTGPTSAETAALTQGYFVEQPHAYTWSLAQPIASIETEILNDYAAAQATFSSSIQPGHYLGTFYNGGWGAQ